MLCGGVIDENNMAGVSGAMAPSEDVSDCVGELTQVGLCGIPMHAFVSNPGAPIRDKGFEVVFLLCSKECACAVRLAAGLDVLNDTGDMPDLMSEGVTGLKRRRLEEGFTPQMLERSHQFEELLREYLPSVAARLGADQPPPDYGPHASPADRARVESMLRRHCAWCARMIEEDEPVEALSVWLNDGDGLAQEGGMTALAVGDRVLPAHVPDVGSPAYGTCDASFILCGRTCTTALGVAIEEDRRLRVVH